MDFKNLLLSRQDHVTTVTLNRPNKRNALSLDLLEELEALSDHFRADDETRVVIFTGAGEHFSVGADLSDARLQERQALPMLSKRRAMTIGPRMLRALHEIDQITIAAINGYALGGAACIATALDFRIGTEDCAIGYPEINRGMNLSWAALPLCVRLVGPARAKRMVILGRRENAQTLLYWGFLDEVVPSDQLLERAVELAAEYAAQPPVQAQMIKRSVNAIVGANDRAVMHMDGDQFLLATSTEDHAEAVRAFFEKREPRFRGN